jgi:hypothetical protein
MPLTVEQKATAIQLRAGGNTYLRIAAKIGSSESTAFKFFKSLIDPAPPKPAPKPTPAVQQSNRKPPAHLLPEHQLNSSCPTRRIINRELLKRRTYTRTEMAVMLEEAWRNTARL